MYLPPPHHLYIHCNILDRVINNNNIYICIIRNVIK